MSMHVCVVWNNSVQGRGGLVGGGIERYGGRGRLYSCCLSGRGVGERVVRKNRWGEA